MLVIGAVLVGIVGAERLVSEARRLRREQDTSASRQSVADVQLRRLKQQHEELSRAHEQLRVDRDNLLVQMPSACCIIDD